MKDVRKHHPDTQCVHASLIHDETGCVVTPIYQTSTFSFRNVDHGAALFSGKVKGYIYTRMGNPTVESVETAVAVLEKGYAGIGCASGMAASHLTISSLVGAGDHMICSRAVYGPTAGLARNVMSRFGVKTTFVDTSDIANIAGAITPETKLIFIETPGNPTMAVTDIEATARLAHDNGIKLAVDNTFMSPILQRPLEWGADVVVHSMTKFLNGHADVVAGIVVVNNEEDYQHFRRMSNYLGGTIDPFNSFLVARGIKTLAIRIERHCSNAMKLAQYLEQHPQVERVMYPGLKSHPQYDRHRKQARGPGGLISFELKGGIEAGKILMNSVELLVLAVSLGGVESLIQHPASMTHSSMERADRLQAGITDGLVRISVGIEDADELIADLEQGLAKIK
ncbi:MAG: aminotransferase class I/II-fold pyridoxal phosphate-dependent enzyme [Candidatus Krumholzibacteriota bacterium]|nr:aminotransferase class I/II-fold pyridoxal phosphate-dependent enzyme [Candidatus Krumholzibacteriota bacterium]